MLLMRRGVEWRRGHCGSLAPWGAEARVAVLRCRQARLSGRRQSDRRAKAATLAGQGSSPNNHSAGCERRSATECSEVGVRRWRQAEQAQTGIGPGAEGGPPEEPLRKHWRRRGPPRPATRAVQNHEPSDWRAPGAEASCRNTWWDHIRRRQAAVGGRPWNGEGNSLKKSPRSLELAANSPWDTNYEPF